MKKCIAGMLVLSSILIGLTSCMSLGASLGTSTKNKKDYQSAVGTPDDSVIFYGNISYNNFQSFSQIDPNYPPDYQEMEKSIFISKPVAPGSTYTLERSAGEYSYYVGRTRYIYYWNTPFSLQTAVNPIVINIPKKPGLYFVGNFDGQKVGEGGKAESIQNGSTDYEIMCLKGALKLYEGTAWESAINARIEELKASKGEVKDEK